MNEVLKRPVGRSPQMGPTRFLLHPRPFSVQRKLDRQEAAREGGPGLTKSDVCFPEWSPHLDKSIRASLPGEWPRGLRRNSSTRQPSR